MKRTVLVTATLLMFVTLHAHAEWSKQYSVDYIMGDGDNRASARQAALEQIKQKAINEAGTYAQKTTTLHENGDLTESIQTLSASMVKVLASDEKLTVNSAGQAVLQIKASASLDDSELIRRIEAVRQDKVKERQVKQLQAENEVLRKDYVEIRKELENKPDQAKITELLAKQDATIKRLADNGKSMSLVFEPGKLVQLATHNADDFEKAKRDLDDNFYAPIMRSPSTAVIESVEADGDGYVALVRVGWTINNTIAKQVLGRYLNVDLDRDTKTNIIVSSYLNLEGRGPKILSELVFKYLISKEVELKIQIVGKSVQLPVFFVDDSFFRDCGFNGGVYLNALGMESKRNNNLCLVSQRVSDAQVLGISNVSNPIRIPLTRAQAEIATHVDASIQLK